MPTAVIHEAYPWLVENIWVRRVAAVVFIWIAVIVVTRASDRFFDLVDRRLTEFGEPKRRLSKLDALFDIFVIIIGVLLSLYALGLGPALWGAMAVTGIVGIILGLAAQRVGQNLLAGLVILFERPFAVGDFVETDAHRGTVSKVTLLSTALVTREGPVVQMPNSLMVDKPLRNFSAAAVRMVEVKIDVLESRDLEKVQAVLRAVPDREPHLVRARPVRVFASESLDEGVRWTLRYFVERDHVATHCEFAAMRYVLDALNDAGLDTALPTQVVRVVRAELESESES